MRGILTNMSRRNLLSALTALPALPAFLHATGPAQAATSSDPLASWNYGAAKDAIPEFVRATTDSSNANIVPPEERVAEFDQDGTLWVEHPIYTQIAFCGPLIKEKPELGDREPFKVVLSGDRQAVAKLSIRELFEIVPARSTTSPQNGSAARSRGCVRLRQRWNRPYTDLVYQPMLEVLSLLCANGFTKFIATGGRRYGGRGADAWRLRAIAARRRGTILETPSGDTCTLFI
jgi:hypothetical protein